jgi:ribosome assembly protein RRB1
MLDSDSESDDDENLDEDPSLEHININHHGGINRIRCMPQQTGIVATMADTNQCHIYDLTSCAQSMMVRGPRAMPPTKPAYSFRGHREEGFAIDWSPIVAGQLATGDCAGKIHVWNTQDFTTGAWQVDGVNG